MYGKRCTKEEEQIWPYFSWQGVREGEEGIGKVGTGVFELPVLFKDISNWALRLLNANLILKSKAESDVALDSNVFKKTYWSK